MDSLKVQKYSIILIHFVYVFFGYLMFSLKLQVNVFLSIPVWVDIHASSLFWNPQVFDGSGSFLSYINTSADPLYGPQGLALTSDGHVVVADSGNHCFKVYRYLQ